VVQRQVLVCMLTTHTSLPQESSFTRKVTNQPLICKCGMRYKPGNKTSHCFRPFVSHETCCCNSRFSDCHEAGTEVEKVDPLHLYYFFK
jgi:hypothetical protein